MPNDKRQPQISGQSLIVFCFCFFVHVCLLWRCHGNKQGSGFCHTVLSLWTQPEGKACVYNQWNFILIKASVCGALFMCLTQAAGKPPPWCNRDTCRPVMEDVTARIREPKVPLPPSVLSQLFVKTFVTCPLSNVLYKTLMISLQQAITALFYTK